MQVGNRRQKNLILSVLASLISFLFLAFGVSKQKANLRHLREKLASYLKVDSDLEDEYYERDLDSTFNLQPTFGFPHKRSVDMKNGTILTYTGLDISWRNDGSETFIIYISNQAMPNSFKTHHTGKNVIEASLDIKPITFDEYETEILKGLTTWQRKIIYEVPDVNAQKLKMFIPADNIFVLILSSKGNWSHLTSHPYLEQNINDPLIGIKVCLEKKSRYYQLHMVIPESGVSAPCNDCKIIIKQSVDVVFEIAIGKLEKSINLKLRNINGGLCYIVYADDFGEQVEKFLIAIPETYEWENSEWFYDFDRSEEFEKIGVV